jgi:uncharacterized protein (TIGR00106 family)
MVAQFSILPIGELSMSRTLVRVMKIIDEGGLDYRVGPMGTSVEGSWEKVLRLIHRCHDAVLANHPRVYTTISIDDRKGTQGALSKKVLSVIEKSGRPLKS